MSANPVKFENPVTVPTATIPASDWISPTSVVPTPQASRVASKPVEMADALPAEGDCEVGPLIDEGSELPEATDAEYAEIKSREQREEEARETRRKNREAWRKINVEAERISRLAPNGMQGEAYAAALTALLTNRPVPEFAAPTATRIHPDKKTGEAMFTDTLKVSGMHAKDMRKIKWLWPQFVPLGKLTIFCGDPGNMKSLATGDLAARGSVGADMPDGSKGIGVFDTLMLIGEDDVEDTTMPRMAAAGADFSHIHPLDGYIRSCVGGQGLLKEIALDDDVALIRAHLLANPKIKLVVIDPLSNYLGNAKMMDDKDVRAKVLMPLKRLAAETGVAIICVMHLNKKVDLGAINRVGGAMAFVGVARMVWLFNRNAKDTDQLFMLQVKANITKRTTGLEFAAREVEIEIEGEMVPQPVIEWKGKSKEPVDQTKDDRRSKRGSYSAEWLRKFLSDGHERPLSVIEKAARLDAGIMSMKSLYNARNECDRRALMGEVGWAEIRVIERLGGDDAKGQMVAFWQADAVDRVEM